MTHGLWLSAAGMQVNEYRQALAANNMANVDTVGFKRNLALVHVRRVEALANPAASPFSNRRLDALSGGLGVKPTYTSFAQGALERTGRDLDAALDGEGFFTVSDGSEVKYTRDGRFAINAAQELVMAAGDGRHRVLDANGAPIVLGDASQGPVRLGEDGTVFQGTTAVAKLGLVTFDDTTALRKSGASLFENVGQAKAAPATARVKGQQVERSTVDPVTALTSMIEVSRAYELNARMITLQDETLGYAVSRVGRIG